jgi:ferredoxin
MKEPGGLKEEHEVGLAIAPPLFDIDAYVEEFGASIVPAYRQGIADAEWPADVGLARSVVPPGTAATRDFSRLAPQLPQLVAERCVGCMACVSACPDSAILGIAVPEGDLEARIASFAETQPAPGSGRGKPQIAFRPHAEVREVPAKHGLEPARIRDLHRAAPLQGLRRVRRGVRGAGTRRAVHDEQGRCGRGR